MVGLGCLAVHVGLQEGANVPGSGQLVHGDARVFKGVYDCLEAPVVNLWGDGRDGGRKREKMDVRRKERKQERKRERSNSGT